MTSLAVFSPERPALKLTKLATSKPDFIVAKVVPLTAEECKQLKTRAGNRVNIEIKPGMPLGTFREELIIETDHPDQPKVTLTLVGSTAGPISVMPNSLRIVTVNGKDGASGQVTLLVREGRSTNFKVAHKPEKIEVADRPQRHAHAQGPLPGHRDRASGHSRGAHRRRDRPPDRPPQGQRAQDPGQHRGRVGLSLDRDSCERGSRIHAIA